MSKNMHLQADLAELGYRLRTDLQTLMAAVELDAAAPPVLLNAENELLVLEQTAQKFQQSLSELLSLDVYLTSGFVPAGLAAPAVGAGDQQDASSTAGSAWSVGVPAAQQARADRAATQQRQPRIQEAAAPAIGAPAVLQARADRAATQQRQPGMQDPAELAVGDASESPPGAAASKVQAPLQGAQASAVPPPMTPGRATGAPAAFGGLREFARLLDGSSSLDQDTQRTAPGVENAASGHDWDWQADLPALRPAIAPESASGWPDASAGSSNAGRAATDVDAAAPSATGLDGVLQNIERYEPGHWRDDLLIQHPPARLDAVTAAGGEGSAAGPASGAALLSPLQPETGQWETILDTLTREIAREYRRFYGA